MKNNNMGDKQTFKNDQPFPFLNNQIKNAQQPIDQFQNRNIPYRQPILTTPASQQFAYNQLYCQQQQNFKSSNANQEGVYYGVNPQFCQQQHYDQGNTQKQQILYQNVPPQQKGPLLINQQNQMNLQNSKQEVDVFATQNQEDVDVFSTSFQYQNYDKERINYLSNKKSSPGNKKKTYETNHYLFTLDNYGDELIIEKKDQSFYLRLNNSFQLNQSGQIENHIKQQFETNIRFDLNYTRVALIQNDEVMAVKFNNGKQIFLKLQME